MRQSSESHKRKNENDDGSASKRHKGSSIAEKSSVELLLKELLDRRTQLQTRNANIDSMEQPQVRYKKEHKRNKRELEVIRHRIAELTPKSSTGFTDTEASGMAHSHSLIFSKYAVANDVIIVWRPINPHAGPRLDRAVNPYKGKGPGTKGKTSNFPFIAGDVPCNAALSKAALIEPKRIPELQKKNDEELHQNLLRYEKVSSELYQRYQAGLVCAADLNEVNDLLLTTDIAKTTKKNETVYYIVNESGDIISDEKTKSPYFVIRNPSGVFLHNTTVTSDDVFDLPFDLKPDWKLKPVTIMAYIQFEFDENHQLIERTYPVTADYDEMVQAGRKLYPFKIADQINNAVQQGLFTRKQQIELISNLVLDYELRLRREHRDVRARQGMGMVNDSQWASKVYLKSLTNGATTHGSEVNNPFPEKILPDNYSVHMPDSSVRILHTEQEICDFINEQRAQGFPLDVNPKWGWDIGRRGKLFIPTVRFNWDEVDDAISLQCSTVKVREESLKKRFEFYAINDTKENRELIKNNLSDAGKTIAQKVPSNLLDGLRQMVLSVDKALAEYASNQEIIECKLQIEKLRLESALIYSQVNNKGQNLKELEENKVHTEYRTEIEKCVKRCEKQQRLNMIKKLKNALKVKNIKHLETFDVESMVAKQERILYQSKNVSKNVKGFTSVTKVPQTLFVAKGKKIEAVLETAPQKKLTRGCHA